MSTQKGFFSQKISAFRLLEHILNKLYIWNLSIRERMYVLLQFPLPCKALYIIGEWRTCSIVWRGSGSQTHYVHSSTYWGAWKSWPALRVNTSNMWETRTWQTNEPPYPTHTPVPYAPTFLRQTYTLTWESWQLRLGLWRWWRWSLHQKRVGVNRAIMAGDWILKRRH